jgi:hypothetical protein
MIKNFTKRQCLLIQKKPFAYGSRSDFAFNFGSESVLFAKHAYSKLGITFFFFLEVPTLVVKLIFNKMDD